MEAFLNLFMTEFLFKQIFRITPVNGMRKLYASAENDRSGGRNDFWK